MKKTNHIIMGSAFTLATVAVAIDHTKHRVPDPIQTQKVNSKTGNKADTDSSPENPCSLNPCSLNPCSLNPCSLNSGDDD